MQIEVSLDVYKALTAQLQFEGHSYNDIIRDLLGLDSPLEPENTSEIGSPTEGLLKGLAKGLGFDGFCSRGLRLPNGTELRARYKQKLYRARISDGEWLDQNGSAQSSPSAAATAITGNNVNGLRFWEALKPGETVWRRLDTLGPSS